MANKIKKIISAILIVITAFSMFVLLTSCSDDKNGEGRVYYLNFKPEQDGDWQKLAKLYTEKTGVPVTVLTASDNQYENTLATEMDKSEAPTLFQVNGAGSVKTCTLLDKPSRREVDFVPDYVGREVPDEFVVGFGLDYDEKYRNLPYVGVLKRETYEK